MPDDLQELSKFPLNPDDNQRFSDDNGNAWVYDVQTESWDFCGPRTNIGLANENTAGLLSPQFKYLLDTVAKFPGAFGIIVDKPYKQTIQGDVKFVSNSVDISCLNSRGTSFNTTAGCSEETVVSCSGEINDATSNPRFEVTLKDSYLQRLCIDLPAPKGPIGKQGQTGPKGKDGYGDGPKGFTGDPGPDVAELLKLGQVIYEDLAEITNCPIVDLELVDKGRGPFFKVTKSCRTLAENECAERLSVTPIVRTLTYSTPITDDDCNLNGLSGWVINKISTDPLPVSPFLVRVSDDETTDCQTITTTLLDQYIQSLVNYYEQKIVQLDKQWSLLSKAHIEEIDSKARTILSNLANDLTRCESTLAGTEFGITFERCEPCSPSSPSTLSVAENGKIGRVEVSGQEWDVVV